MFNALKYSKKLEEVGFSREQAETSIDILMEIMRENLATSQDLKDVETELKNELNIKFSDVFHSIEKLESKMTIKLGAMLVTTIAVMTAIQKLLS